MAKKKIFTSDSFKLVSQFKAVCVRGDFSGHWKATKHEAIKDALEHQDSNPSHRVDILVEDKQQYVLKIGQDEIDMVLKLL